VTRAAFRGLLLVPLLLLFNAPAPRVSHHAVRLAAGDVTTRAVRAGSGDTTLLFLHGYGESLVTWQGVLDPLSRRHAVLAVDLPGFGLADKPDGPYDLPTQLARLTSLLDQETRGPVVVVGHSMGGALGTALALDRPDRIVAAVLIAPGGDSIGLAGLVDSVTPGEASAVGWWEAVRAWAIPVHAPTWLDDGALAAYDPLADPAYRNAATRTLSDFDFTALRPRFAELRLPVLLLWGELDPVVPVGVGRRLAREIPCAELVTFPRTFHRPQVAYPEAVTVAIETFLARHSDRATPCLQDSR
jgi:pimeloyl-ACP methyl ester carboxylesterase